MPEAISWITPRFETRANLYHLPAGFSLFLRALAKNLAERIVGCGPACRVGIDLWSAGVSKSEMPQVHELPGVKGRDIYEGLRKDGQPSP